MSDLKIKFGLRVKQFRKKTGLTQIEMNNLISYSYFRLIEKGEANITLDMIERIAIFFDIEVKELFDFEKLEK